MSRTYRSTAGRGNLPVTIVHACLRGSGGGDGGGSPTAVLNEASSTCANGPLTDDERRGAAALAGTSHAVFLSDERDGEDGSGRNPPVFAVRFFTSEGELPACGHGTVAALAFLAEQAGGREYRANLRVSGRVIEGRVLREASSSVKVGFTTGPVGLRGPAPGELVALLPALGLPTVAVSGARIARWDVHGCSSASPTGPLSPPWPQPPTGSRPRATNWACWAASSTPRCRSRAGSRPACSPRRSAYRRTSPTRTAPPAWPPTCSPVRAPPGSPSTWAMPWAALPPSPPTHATHRRDYWSTSPARQESGKYAACQGSCPRGCERFDRSCRAWPCDDGTDDRLPSSSAAPFGQRPSRALDHQRHRSRMRHHHQRPAVHSLTQPGFGRVRRSNSTSIRSTKRPRSARAPLGRCRRASSRSSRPSSISMPGLSPGPVRYRPGCLKAQSNRLSASATASGHMCSASTRLTAARVRADTPGIRRTGTCLGGRHRSARTAFGRLRGIALSDKNHARSLPRPASPETGRQTRPHVPSKTPNRAIRAEHLLQSPLVLRPGTFAESLVVCAGAP